MVIGITGGVGSGKTTAAKILANECNAKLLITDEIARQLMNPGNQAYVEIVDYFGEEIVLQDGSIDRKKLAAIVFNDNDKLKKLNSFTHPHVMNYIKDHINKADKNDILVIESAILMESNINRYCDEVWYIMTGEEIRAKRLSDNRGYSKEKTESIIKNQSFVTIDEAKELFEKVIINDGNIENLQQQLIKALL